MEEEGEEVEIEPLIIPLHGNPNDDASSILIGSFKEIKDSLIENLDVAQTVISDLSKNLDLCVKAYCGSGKTRTLECAVLGNVTDPCELRSCLLLSFTKNACQELIHRFVEHFGKGILTYLNIFTFHALALERLNERDPQKKPLRTNVKIVLPLSDKKCEEVVLFLLKDERFRKYRNFDESVLGIIHDVNIRLNVHMENPTNIELEKRLLFQFYKDRIKSVYGRVEYDVSDFMSILIEYFTIVKSDGDPFLADFIRVFGDEIQDLDEPQYELLKLVCNGKKTYLTLDPFQRIYHFLGRSVAFEDRMSVDFPSMQTKELKYNYRSVKTIDYALKCLVSGKKASREELGDAFEECIFYIPSESFQEQVSIILNIVKDLKERNKSVYIISRTNSTGQHIAKEMSKKKIDHSLWTDESRELNEVIIATPFKVKGGEAFASIIPNFAFSEFPHMRCDFSADMTGPQKLSHYEVERNVFYEAFGRAKGEVYLTNSNDMNSAPSFQKKRILRNPGISPFMKFIQDIVVSRDFGLGDHPDIERCRHIEKAEINFDEYV